MDVLIDKAQTIFPWIALLIVFCGLIGLCFKLAAALSTALKDISQLLGGVGAAHVAPTPLPPPATPTTVQPKPAPPAQVILPKAPEVVPAVGPFANGPLWFRNAVLEIGFHETGDNHGIGRYVNMAHAGAEGDPWCAIFVNAMLENAGIAGSRSASSQSFRTDTNFTRLAGPALGAIVVFWRGSQPSGLGHVGFYRGENANSVWVLGGNEDDMVQIEALSKASPSFGLVGYWWPKSVPLPDGGPVMMPTGSPLHVVTAPGGTAPIPQASVSNGKQTGIIATMFGGPKSAYGGPIIDNMPGCALPFHFHGDRQTVRVTSRTNGKSVDCAIVDVGPWNTNDPYWQNGARPQAETGVDMDGRKTNRAGIDLTLAAASAIQLDGKGLVDWEFVQSPTSTETPKVS